MSTFRYPACWLTMTRETCPFLPLFDFSNPSRHQATDSRRRLGPNPHVPSILSRVLIKSRSCNLAHSLGLLIKTLLLLLLLLPSLSLLLSRFERVLHEKSCQMAICGIFELHVRTYWLCQKLYTFFLLRIL